MAFTVHMGNKAFSICITNIKNLANGDNNNLTIGGICWWWWWCGKPKSFFFLKISQNIASSLPIIIWHKLHRFSSLKMILVEYLHNNGGGLYNVGWRIREFLCKLFNNNEWYGLKGWIILQQ